MFANSQLSFELKGQNPSLMSPLRTLGEMARRTTDPATLLVLQAGLEGMIKESKRGNVFVHDQLTAEADLRHLVSRTGRQPAG